MQTKPFLLLGVKFGLLSITQAVDLATKKIETKDTNYICLISVHPLIEAQFHTEYKNVLNRAGLVLPDGMPIIWAARLFGRKIKNRTYGPDLMLELLAIAENKGYSNFFYGGTKEILTKLKIKLKDKFPKLKIAGTLAPPFRELTKKEDEKIIKYIKDASPDILWVGLGVPKQDIWMNLHKDRLKGIIQIGVGAAFSFHAGVLKQAPKWMQRHGLEWFFRITQEPRRLWWRYLKCVPLFIIFVFLQYVGIIRYKRQKGK